MNRLLFAVDLILLLAALRSADSRSMEVMVDAFNVSRFSNRAIKYQRRAAGEDKCV